MGGAGRLAMRNMRSNRTGRHPQCLDRRLRGVRRLNLILALLLGVVFSTTRAAQSAQAQSAPAPMSAKNIFHIKYISDGSVYLDSGRNDGLEEGMILHLVHADPSGGTTESVRFQEKEPIADVRVFSVADSSSAAEIIKSREDLAAGDIAYLDNQSIRLREDKINAVESEHYPVVVTFSYGDPLDEEIRATTIPANKVQIVNQIRGRIGWDLGNLSEPGGVNSRQIGFLLDADMSRIGGTHWNFTGYWRGNFNTQSTGNLGTTNPQTLTDLLNRTYHLGLYYQNPDSIVTMGVGRLYLPYAPSLSTIDGGYFGERITPRVTVGAFGGSTPDPTSWSYNPNQRIAGTFINYERGDFEHLHMTDTAGLAMTSIGWHVAREFAFLEDTFSLGHTFSIYNSLQADKARTALAATSTAPAVQYGTGLTQSFTTLRFQPIKFLTFNLNDNYLRNLPTFDPALISTGLLDQYLFQGLSGGVRVELPYRIALSTDVGRSKTSTDTKTSWNQMYGINFGEIRNTGLQLDLRYTKFNSSFGHGTYQYVSLSRSLSDRLHVGLQGGIQHLNSTLSANSNSKFITSTVDWTIGPRYFVEGLFSWNRGTSMNYQQMNFTFGYRFGGSLRK
jgi:hypothetical protein